ncbi:MAG TPA: DUF4129 domain-containing protein [Gemmatimonadales bacterium]|nr:DUF4129 domain-containing protein [Gemmatimonadales bacterium]
MVGQVFARPEFQWIERQRIASWLARQWHELINWLDRLADQHPIGFNVGLALVVVGLVVLLVHIGYVMWRIVRPTARTGTAKAAAGVGVIADAASHLARADELARARRYAEALAHRFMAVVLELDQRKALRFHASKTPAEYVGEARLDDAGRTSLASLVAQLYRHLFGAVPCDAGEYQTFGAAAQELVRGHHVVPA